MTVVWSRKLTSLKRLKAAVYPSVFLLILLWFPRSLHPSLNLFFPPISHLLSISLFSSVMRAGGVSQSPNTQHVCFARHQGPTAYCSPTDWVNRQINAELSGLLVYFCRSTLHWEYMMKTACSSNRGRTRGLTGGWHRPAPWNLNCCLLALLMDCKWLHRVQAQVIKIT